MTVRLENLTSRPVTVALNSGTVVHIPPGHAVESAPVEIEDNAMVRKLRDRLVLAVAEPDDAGDTDETGDTGAGDGDGDAAAADDDDDEDAKPTTRRRRRQS